MFSALALQNNGACGLKAPMAQAELQVLVENEEIGTP